jgi:putative hydrolase of the HAD superfamily
MDSMNIEAVIFDLGGTLIEYAGPYAVWPDLEAPGLEAAYYSLQAKGAALPSFEQFAGTGFNLLPQRWQMATKGERNLRLIDFLAEILEVHDGFVPNQEWLAEAASLYQDAICAQAVPLEAAQETLDFVKRQGYRIGLLSNTMFSGSAHIADLKRFSMDEYFDAMLFSADAGKWKPSAEPYLELMNQLDVAPENGIFIGDDPANDMVGGHRAGLRTILLRSSQRFQQPDGVNPDSIISHLSELPVVLANWSNEK